MLVDGVPDLYGRIDLLTEDIESLVIKDIKTTRSKWGQEEVEDSGEQLVVYSHLASEISPGKKIATRFLVLTKTTEPAVEEHVLAHWRHEVRQTIEELDRRGFQDAVGNGSGLSRHVFPQVTCLWDKCSVVRLWNGS
jgi:hypothetical protein